MSDATATDLVEAAKGLFELIDGSAVEAERQGALTDAVVDALHDTGLWSMWVPRELGGGELDPVASLEVLEAVSRADASTGWVLMAAALATGADAAYLGDEAAAELFGSGEPRVRVHVGAGTQPGHATSTDGGLLVSGNWSFASGLKHAQVIHTAAIVAETGEARICNFPIEQATITDNWDVLGLRATGSIDYTTDSLFVAEPYSYNATTEVPRRGGHLYTMGIINLGIICHSAWALGVGRRMLDELRALIESKRGRAGSLADNDAFLGEFMTAEAKLRSARALVYDYWHENEETIRRGDHLSLEQESLNRLSLVHTTWTVEEVCTWVYHAAGTTALRAGTIQRGYRDIHAGTQHMTSSPPVRQAIGRQLAGLAPGMRWQFVRLVDEG